MKRITGSHLAATAFGTTAKSPRIPSPASRHCAACGGEHGDDVRLYVPGKTFNDIQLFSQPSGREICPYCDGLLFSDVATAEFSGTGVVTAKGFSNLRSGNAKLTFLVAPPEPPFALAIVTAKRQHVWWMARVAYDRDLIPLQFGHRALQIDRPRAIAAADAVLDYEQATSGPRAQSYVMVPLSDQLKSSSDGQYTHRFQTDEGNQAKALRSQLSRLSLGDLWAMSQLRAGARRLKQPTVAAAATAAAAAALQQI